MKSKSPLKEPGYFFLVQKLNFEIIAFLYLEYYVLRPYSMEIPYTTILNHQRGGVPLMQCCFAMLKFA